MGMKGRRPVAPTLYSVGHSTHSATEFVDILRSAGIARLADIRGFPRSQANPQFNMEVLPATLAAAGVRYVHLPALGGRRPRSTCIDPQINAGWQHQAFHNYADYAMTPAFLAGFSTLLEFALGEPTAMMCAEAMWWQCHRRIVADYALARGTPVVHLFTVGKAEAASLTPFAIIDANSGVSYPAGARTD
jgi:uncharacterized protein (DUF488 family)